MARMFPSRSLGAGQPGVVRWPGWHADAVAMPALEHSVKPYGAVMSTAPWWATGVFTLGGVLLAQFPAFALSRSRDRSGPAGKVQGGDLVVSGAGVPARGGLLAVGRGRGCQGSQDAASLQPPVQGFGQLQGAGPCRCAGSRCGPACAVPSAGQRHTRSLVTRRWPAQRGRWPGSASASAVSAGSGPPCAGRLTGGRIRRDAAGP